MDAGERPALTTAVAVASLAAVIEQVSHEAVHGLTALLVGKSWLLFNFFAVETEWPGEADRWGDIAVSGSAATFNILCGLASALAFRRTGRGRPVLRLFLLYLAAFSLLAGFGYLMVDPLMYNPAAEQLGDWKAIVRLLGGGWDVRAPIAAIGLAGVLGVFFWLPKAALRFVPDPLSRKTVALRILFVPYLTVCGLFTLLALGHPLGLAGIWLMVFKYWCGFAAVGWGFPMAAFWLRTEIPYPDASPLPGRPSFAWIAVSVAVVAGSAAVLLPTLAMS